MFPRNDARAASLLIDAGADINARNLRGHPPIQLAAALGHGKVLEVLLNAPSADPNTQVSKLVGV